MDVHINNLEKFAGDGVELVENPKFIEKREKEFFMNLMNIVSSLDTRSTSLLNFGIDLVAYEDPYYQLIEGLIVKHYGPTKGGVMLWWCGERKMLPSKTYNMIDEHGNQTQVSNLNQLYNFLKKLK